MEWVRAYGRGILLTVLRLVLIAGIAWLVLSLSGGSLFGLPQPWSTLLALVLALVAFPIVAYLLFLAVLLLYPVFTGKRIDWR